MYQDNREFVQQINVMNNMVDYAEMKYAVTETEHERKEGTKRQSPDSSISRKSLQQTVTSSSKGIQLTHGVQ